MSIKQLNMFLMKRQTIMLQSKKAVILSVFANIKGSLEMQKILLVLGVIIILMGLFWPYVSRLPIGKLPLDITLKLGNTQIYLPIGSSILVSLILTILLRLFR